MKRYKFNVFILSILLTLYSLLLSPPASAQQLSLSMTPPLLEVVMKPGKSILIAYSVFNLADPAVLRSRVSSFEPLNTRGDIRIKENLEGPIRFTLDNADLQMGDSFFAKTRDKKQLLLRIRAPEGAPEGDYYYTFLVEAQAPPGAEGVSSSQTQGRIGSNILITLTNSGRVDINGKISSFDVLSGFPMNFFGKKIRIFDSADKIPVRLEAANEGRNLIKPNGDITLTGNFGEKSTYSILPQNILAGSRRFLTATPSAELFRPLPEPVSLVLSGFFLGNYKLSTKMSFGEGSPNVFGETSFFALPIKFLMGLLIVIVLGLYLVRRFGQPEKPEKT